MSGDFGTNASEGAWLELNSSNLGLNLKHSRLSFGAKNIKHRSYQKNEGSIHKALDDATKERTRSIRVTDICRMAKISSPTFYLHYRNVDDAIHKREEKLRAEFCKLLPEKALLEVKYTVLLSFIRKQKRYFSACFDGYDIYLLSILVRQVRPLETHGKVVCKAYINYIAIVSGILVGWGKYEKFDKELIPYYAKRLSHIRVMAED